MSNLESIRSVVNEVAVHPGRIPAHPHFSRLYTDQGRRAILGETVGEEPLSAAIARWRGEEGVVGILQRIQRDGESVFDMNLRLVDDGENNRMNQRVQLVEAQNGYKVVTLIERSEIKRDISSRVTEYMLSDEAMACKMSVMSEGKNQLQGYKMTFDVYTDEVEVTEETIWPHRGYLTIQIPEGKTFYYAVDMLKRTYEYVPEYENGAVDEGIEDMVFLEDYLAYIDDDEEQEDDLEGELDIEAEESAIEVIENNANIIENGHNEDEEEEPKAIPPEFIRISIGSDTDDEGTQVLIEIAVSQTERVRFMMPVIFDDIHGRTADLITMSLRKFKALAMNGHREPPLPEDMFPPYPVQLGSHSTNN